MSLHFYNTLTKKNEEFKSLENKKIKLYTCGPTVYNYVHIGNLRTFSFEDLLVKYLRYLNYEVLHVMNLTDVDDKTIKGSISEGISLNKYTKKYKNAFFEDIKTLNFSKANHYPAATEYIDEMVHMIKVLIKKEFAYKADDNSIYFSIKKFKNYGKLSGIKIDQLKNDASGRLSEDEYSKDDAQDFVLWKAWSSNDGDVFWETELGKGRPGWHLECSAMSIKLLGESFDIHCGGVDNTFPHHENEIAQSEAFSGKKFVNYWLHSAFLNINSEKMAKSKGNFYTLRELIEKGHDPMSIRYSLISTHYRQPLNFSDDLLNQSSAALKRVNEFINNMSQIKNDKDYADFDILIDTCRQDFINHMDDDLNISGALGCLFDFIRKTNSISSKISSKNGKEAVNFIKELNEVIGCFDTSSEILEDEILNLIKQREAARLNKDYAKSDEIRDYLLQMKIKLKDSKDGTIWEKI